MEDKNALKMPKILDRQKFCGLTEVCVRILIGKSIDIDKGIGFFWSGYEMNNIEDDFLEVVRLINTEDDIVSDLVRAVEFGGEGSVGYDGEDHLGG